MGTPVQAEESARRTSLSILQLLLTEYHPRDFTIRFWDGCVRDAELGQPVRFTLILRHPGALRSMLRSQSERAPAEAHIQCLLPHPVNICPWLERPPMDMTGTAS